MRCAHLEGPKQEEDQDPWEGKALVIHNLQIQHRAQQRAHGIRHSSNGCTMHCAACMTSHRSTATNKACCATHARFADTGANGHTGMKLTLV